MLGYDLLAESPVARFVAVTLLALVAVPIVVLAASFVNRASVKYFRYRRNKNSCSHLPQHPLSGLGLYQDPKEDIELKVKKLTKADASGEMYELVAVGPDIDGRQTVLINDADLAQQVFTSSDATEFPKAPLYEDIVAEALLGDGLVTVTGLNKPALDRWQFHRKLLTPLFHFKSLKDMIPMMVLYTQDLVFHIEKKGTEEWHSAADVLSRFTLSQIVWLAFGGTMDIDWLHERQVEIGHSWSKYAALHVFFGKAISWVPFTPAWKVMKLRRETEKAMYDVIAQLRQEGVESQTHPNNLIATMLYAKDPKTGRAVTDKEIVEEACTMLFAGFDTTSVTMSWALYYMARNPDAMRWVQQELDSVFGYGPSARAPTMEDLPKLKRTRAMINETLRLRPPLMVAARHAPKPVKVGTYDVPAETIVSVNIFAIQRNPKYWPEPNSFVPQRWEEDSDADASESSEPIADKPKRHSFAFLPFSAGARNCIGKNFAMQEMIIAMSMILSKFNIEYDLTRPMQVVGSPVPTPDVFLRFYPRK